MMANQAWKRALDRAGVAFVVYLAVACVVTWPAVINLTRRLPLDLGDPLLNSWILAWDWSRLLRFAQGDLGALRGFWNAGIFYPEPLALAYSEHLVAQAFQALPLFALTREVVLCYNVLFLSTFALSGLGAFLFVRQITGDGCGWRPQRRSSWQPQPRSCFPTWRCASTGSGRGLSRKSDATQPTCTATFGGSTIRSGEAG